MPTYDVRAHEWLSFVEVSGLLVSEPVLHAHFPSGPEPVGRREVRTLDLAWESFLVDPGDTNRYRQWLQAVLYGLLGLPSDNMAWGADLPSTARYRLAEHDTTLVPRAVLHDDSGKILLGVWSIPHGRNFRRVERDEGQWRTTPLVKLERWLRGVDVPFGLLTNGEDFLLMHAPPLLPASFMEFDARLWLDEKQMLDGFRTLLCSDRWFGPSRSRLEALAVESRARQANLTDTLGVQVREAVELLILALDRQDAHGTLLGTHKPEEVYRAAIYVVMRLVFLLFAEERGLLPHGNVHYDEPYGLSRLAAELEEERRTRPRTFEHAADAWPRILALFRLVFHGCPHPDLLLPAYGGDLFDPNGDQVLALLERPELCLPNHQVYRIVRRLTHGEVKLGRTLMAQRFSYRTLDVEHIGYLYEGLLDHTARRAGSQPMVKLRGGGETAMALTELESRQGAALVDFIAKASGKGGAKESVASALAKPDKRDLEALGRYGDEVCRRCRPYASVIQVDEVAAPGRLYVTTSASRRETGTHYTPVQFTRSLVEESLAPHVYENNGGVYEEPRRVREPRGILELKVCDPAMGSGAFLVQVVRYLSERLVEAWDRASDTYGRDTPLYMPFGEPMADRADRIRVPAEREQALNWARRFVAERCVYGVDVNPLAVEMAKLSLWLVTLDRERPFTFLDHALKCGDSLLGIASLDQLETWSLDARREVLPFLSRMAYGEVRDPMAKRLEVASSPTVDIQGVRHKAELNEHSERALAGLRKWADVLVASSMDPKKRRRRTRDAVLLQKATHEPEDLELDAELKGFLGGHVPFHWPLEFPEVFHAGARSGFHALVGNPPFMGGQKITGNLGTPYRGYLVEHLADGNKGSADLAAYFFLRAHRLARPGGIFGLLAVNTIAEGDTRQVGLERLLKGETTIIRAWANEPWPNQAAVVTSRVVARKGPWRGRALLNDEPVERVSAFLSVGPDESPKRLRENQGLSYIGSYVLGMGFVVSEAQARAWIEEDPANKDVLFPYLNGQDLTTNPDQAPSRWVINFWDWPEERARRYEKPFRWIEERVKPERQRKNNGRYVLRRPLPQRWWQHGEKRPAMYHALGRGNCFENHPENWCGDIVNYDRVLCIAQNGKYLSFAWQKNDIVFSHMLIVFLLTKSADFSVCISSVHYSWVVQFASKLKTDLRYFPSDCFDTFPFPSIGEENADILNSIGSEYHNHRSLLTRNRCIGITSLYNLLHDPSVSNDDIVRFRNLQQRLDRHVADAYGWEDLNLDHGFHRVAYIPTGNNIRFTISEPARLEILSRLFELNRQRWEAERLGGPLSPASEASRPAAEAPLLDLLRDAHGENAESP